MALSAGICLRNWNRKGLKGLAHWDNGFKQFSANRPLRKPEDFRGLKMRVQSSKVLEAVIREPGALPRLMAFSEVCSALQQKVVDGVGLNLFVASQIARMGLTEVSIACLPWVFVLLAYLIPVPYVPSVSLWLPNPPY